jgi:hypothetical protein
MGGDGNGLGDSLLLLPAAMVGEASPLHSLTVKGSVNVKNHRCGRP